MQGILRDLRVKTWTVINNTKLQKTTNNLLSEPQKYLNHCHLKSLSSSPLSFSDNFCILLVLQETGHHFQCLQLSCEKSTQDTIRFSKQANKQTNKPKFNSHITYQCKIPIRNYIFNRFKSSHGVFYISINSIQYSKGYVCIFFIVFNFRYLRICTTVT